MSDELKKYVVEESQQFDVECVDNTMQISDLTLGLVYKVLGFLQGFFIMKNDKGRLGKYYRDRFVVREDEEDS